MNNTISKLTKYFLYSILVVLIGKFIFYIPIFYTINMDNFKEMIQFRESRYYIFCCILCFAFTI